MIELTIDGKFLNVEAGITVMDAALQQNIIIPSMCHHKDLPHFPSCMICLVKEVKTGRLFTSCSVNVFSGMDIITEDDEIREARKTALDLLLSDHVGDCEAPCQITCPAHMDIPQMNHLLAEGEFEKAYEVVIKDIAIPSILGHICPAPCEGACRRNSLDGAVSICFLKRFAGDYGAEVRGPRVRGDDRVEGSENSEIRNPVLNSEVGDSGIVKNGLKLSPVTGHSSLPPHQVAVIGSGPHGLSAAWYLQLFGFQCTIFDRNPLPGGALRYSVHRALLPEEVLDREIERIRLAGVIFQMNAETGPDKIKELEQEYAAVVYPLEKAPKMAIKASALGKEAAWKVRQKLLGLPETGEPRMFNSRFGRLQESEALEYLKESVPVSRIEPALGFTHGMTAEEVVAEAARCLHCECRKPDHCQLRIFSHEYGSDQKRFQGPKRKAVTRQFQHATVIYEPQKCIKCSICVRITSKHQEEYGLTFIGRGFDVVVGVPFGESVRAGLTHTAEEAANACPTGALAMKGGKK
jgi:ferredoxin